MSKRGSRRNRFAKGPKIVPGATVRQIGNSGVRAPDGSAPQAPRPMSQMSASPPGVVPNLIAGVSETSNPYSPQQPVQPFGPAWGVDTPVNWDYWPGVNLQFSPPQMDLMQMLRAMARGWGTLAVIKEKRIDQILRLPWDFQLIGQPKKPDKRLDALRAFWKRPDRKDSFGKWQRRVWEDHFEIDATAIYIHRAIDGKTPYALETLDGALIKPLIDDLGRRPDYPSPAFQQIRRGLPYLDLTEMDLLYAPMRTHPSLPVYGYSNVQMIYVNIQEAIKKDLYMNNFWQSGNMPDMMISVPDDWKPHQIAAYQAFFEQFSGNPNFKTKVRFVPGGMKPFDIKNSSGESLWSGRDEILIRIACFAFGMSPQGFTRMMNRATAETASDEAEEQGLHPELRWFKDDVMDLLVQSEVGWNWPDIEFNYLPDPQVDALKQAQTLTLYVKEGVMSRDEARDPLNLPPVPGGAELTVDTVTGPVPVKETVEANRQRALAAPQQLANDQESHDTNIAGQQKNQEQIGKEPSDKHAGAGFPQVRSGLLRRRDRAAPARA